MRLPWDGAAPPYTAGTAAARPSDFMRLPWVSAHFGFNLFHILLFTYPLLVRR